MSVRVLAPCTGLAPCYGCRRCRPVHSTPGGHRRLCPSLTTGHPTHMACQDTEPGPICSRHVSPPAGLRAFQGHSWLTCSPAASRQIHSAEAEESKDAVALKRASQRSRGHWELNDCHPRCACWARAAAPTTQLCPSPPALPLGSTHSPRPVPPLLPPHGETTNTTETFGTGHGPKTRHTINS